MALKGDTRRLKSTGPEREAQGSSAGKPKTPWGLPCVWKLGSFPFTLYKNQGMVQNQVQTTKKKKNGEGLPHSNVRVFQFQKTLTWLGDSTQVPQSEHHSLPPSCNLLVKGTCFVSLLMETKRKISSLEGFPDLRWWEASHLPGNVSNPNPNHPKPEHVCFVLSSERPVCSPGPPNNF